MSTYPSVKWLNSEPFIKSCQVISDSKTFLSNYISRDNRFYGVIRYSELCRIKAENISKEDENASSDFK